MARSFKMNFGRRDYAVFLLYVVYAASSLAVPVALPQIAADLGFSLEDGGRAAGGGLQLGRTVAMVATMALCGFWAGRWGTRQTLGISTLLLSLGMGLLALSPAYGILFLAMLLAGCGEGVIEGLATPFTQSLHAQESGRYITFSHSFWSVGVLATTLLCGYALSAGVSWRILAGGIGFISLIPVWLLMQKPRPEEHLLEHTEPLHWREVWGQAVKICRIPRFWLFFAAMFLAGGGEFCLTFWSASHIQLNFNASAWYGGVGTAFFAGGMVLGRAGWGVLLHQRHLPLLVTVSAAVGALVTLPFPQISNLWLFCGLLFVAGVATAPFWPSVQSYCVDRLPGADARMLLILLSCAGVPGCGFFTYLMGVVGDHAGSLSVAFYIVPVCYFVLGILILIDWIFLPPHDAESRTI